MTQPTQDASHLVGLWSAIETGQHLSCSGSVHTSQAGGVCLRPRRHYRQSAVAISSCHRTLPFWLHSAQTVVSEHSVIDSGCSEDFSPGIYHVSTQLLQFAPVRRIQLPAAKGSVSNLAVRMHHCSPTEVAMASCSSKRRVQARLPGSPVVGWTDTIVPSFRHSAHCPYWQPSASICV